jgi:hypothetical protein
VTLAEPSLGYDEQGRAGKLVFQGQSLGSRIGKLIAPSHHETIKGEVLVQCPRPAVSVARHIGKSELPGVLEKCRRRSRGWADHSESQLATAFSHAIKVFLEQRKVVFRDPIERELVGTPQHKGVLPLLQKSEGIDPQSETFLRDDPPDLILDLFPNVRHRRLMFPRSRAFYRTLRRLSKVMSRESKLAVRVLSTCHKRLKLFNEILYDR